MSNLYLKNEPTLFDYQTYIKDMVLERGFDKNNVSELFQLFLEECGELAKAARKKQGLHTDSNSKEDDVGLEAADVFMYLLNICNQFDIDLEKSFREKEEMNKKRVWEKCVRP